MIASRNGHMARRGIRRTAGFFLLAALMSACNGSGGPGGLWDVPELSRQIIRPWLYCSDCTDGELARITNKGKELVPYLSSALLDGPPRHDDSLAARRSIDAVTRMIRYRARRNESMTPADSTAAVRRQHDAFLMTYRLRAAQALRTLEPIRAASEVARLCLNPPPELQRQPVYRTSFQAIGSCP